MGCDSRKCEIMVRSKMLLVIFLFLVILEWKRNEVLMAGRILRIVYGDERTFHHLDRRNEEDWLTKCTEIDACGNEAEWKTETDLLRGLYFVVDTSFL